MIWGTIAGSANFPLRGEANIRAKRGFSLPRYCIMVYIVFIHVVSSASRLGEPMTERRGARTSMRYHAECFSGFADPRSQANSSMHVGKLANTQLEAAPKKKAGSKMRSSRHFEKGGDRRSMSSSSGGGKIAAFSGGMGFAAGQSSKGVVVEAPGAAEHGGLSMAMLEEHTKRMMLEEKEEEEKREEEEKGSHK